MRGYDEPGMDTLPQDHASMVETGMREWNRRRRTAWIGVMPAEQQGELCAQVVAATEPQSESPCFWHGVPLYRSENR